MPLRRLRTTTVVSVEISSDSWPSCMGWECNARKGKAARRRLDLSCATAGSIARLVDELVLLDPGHHRAQLLADHLDLVFGVQAAARLQRRRAGTVLEDEALRVFAG